MKRSTAKLSKPQTKSNARKSIVVYGDPQAAAVATVLQRLEPVTEHYDVVYVGLDFGATLAKMDQCAIFLEQRSDKPSPAPPLKAQRVRFPVLDFNILWPFNRPNDSNRPEPDFPFGRFPYGDSFITSCLQQKISAESILQLYFSPNWTAGAWPDLDLLFRKESSRLTARDAQCDVRMGSYALKHFRKVRLFVAPTSPTDVLLSELISRLLVAAFPNDPDITQSDVPGTLSDFGNRDMLGILAVPIHPRVAAHFALEWYDRSDTYNYFDRAQLRDFEYYNDLIAAALDADKR